MAVVYTETLIDDTSTDADSPINETLMQNIGQSINYLLDSVLSGGANSERIGICIANFGAGLESPVLTATDNDASTSTFYIYIPSQYAGIDVNFRMRAYWDTDSDAADRVDLVVGSDSSQTLEKTADFGIGGASAGTGNVTSTVTPGSTGLVTCTLDTYGIGSNDSVRVDNLIFYIAST